MRDPKISQSHLDQVVSFLLMLSVLMLALPIVLLIAAVGAVKIALSIWS
jgi:hypothetical protein